MLGCDVARRDAVAEDGVHRAQRRPALCLSLVPPDQREPDVCNHPTARCQNGACGVCRLAGFLEKGRAEVPNREDSSRKQDRAKGLGSRVWGLGSGAEGYHGKTRFQTRFCAGQPHQNSGQRYTVEIYSASSRRGSSWGFAGRRAVGVRVSGFAIRGFGCWAEGAPLDLLTDTHVGIDDEGEEEVEHEEEERDRAQHCQRHTRQTFEWLGSRVKGLGSKVQGLRFKAWAGVDSPT
eukprot:1834506-Rhodomonas_salina.1